MTVEATLQRPRIWSTAKGIVLIMLAVVALWFLSPLSPITIALLAITALFFFGLKRPVWAMASFLVSQLTVTSYIVNNPLGIPISLRLSLLILVGLVLLRFRTHDKIELGPKAKRVLIPALVILGLSVVSNLINSGFDYAFKDFRNILAGLLVAIFLPLVIKDLKDLKILLGVVFIGITASALVGLVQHYHFFGFGQKTLTPGFLQQWGDQPRVPGVAESELELSYTLCIAALTVLGIFLTKGTNKSKRTLLGLSAVLMGLVLYFTYTRSALLAIILGLVALVLFIKTKVKPQFVLIGFILVIAFIEIFGMRAGISLGGRSASDQEESAVSRPILWQAGIAIAMDNPILGIGGNQFIKVSPSYSDRVDPSLIQWEKERYWGFRTLGNEAIHNDFLNVWVSYGSFALIAYLVLLVAIIRNFHDSYRVSKNRFIKGLSIGLAAGLVAYAANAFYHNCLDTMPLMWILAGFSIGIFKITLKTKDQTQIPELPPGAGS